mgnify:FL=1
MPTIVVDRPYSPVRDSNPVRPSSAVRRRNAIRQSSAVRQSSAQPCVPVEPQRYVEPGQPACAAYPELFLDPALETEPVPSAPARVRRQHAALAAAATEVCASCPLLTACLYRAVVEYDVAGFVAGTTERQRSAIRDLLEIEVEPEDLDNLAGVVGGQRTVDHDEVVRLRKAHPEESLERIARRLGCSLSTVKRHLRKERKQPSGASLAARPRPTHTEVRQATAEVLAENSGSRRAAA